ncbi:MAG: sensor histidine kinase [Eubacteriales bacterium]|nr:sensor histidine kinase [Eubacteriales bacterium]
MNLRMRLLLYFIIISVLPVILVGSISYLLTYNNISENAIRMNSSVVERVASDIAKTLEDDFNFAKAPGDSISYQEAMRKEFESLEDLYATELRISLNMYVESKYRSEIFGLYLLGENGGSFKSTFCTFLNADKREIEWYNEAYQTSEMTYLGLCYGSEIVASLDEPMLVFGCPFVDKATGEKCGVIIMEIAQENLIDLLSFDIGSSGYMAILDVDNKIVASVGVDSLFNSYSDALENTNNPENLTESRKLYSRSPIIITETIGNTEFSLVCIIPESEIIRESKNITIIIALLCFSICIIALILSWNFSGKVTKPIKKLISIMHRVEAGDLTVSMVPKYNDEIGMLFTSFNMMIHKINGLMQSIQDDHEKLRVAEMRSLMEQIKPHFLYNTLDTIIWLCRMNKAKEAAIMTDALASYFRIGLSKGKNVISIKEELTHAKYYLTIQSFHDVGLFTYNIEADEELFHYQTVKFILQPLVENAICHGIYSLNKKGNISVKVYEEDDNIVMSVSDNGMGMNPVKAKNLESLLKADNFSGTESYGLVNVNQRVKNFFGQQYGIRFFSIYGSGSNFEIIIPKVMEI